MYSLIRLYRLRCFPLMTYNRRSDNSKDTESAGTYPIVPPWILYHWRLKLGSNDLERGNLAFGVINCRVWEREEVRFRTARNRNSRFKGSKRRVSPPFLHLMQVLSTWVRRGHRRHGDSGGKSIILALYVSVYAYVCASCSSYLRRCDETVRWFAISDLLRWRRRIEPNTKARFNPHDQMTNRRNAVYPSCISSWTDLKIDRRRRRGRCYLCAISLAASKIYRWGRDTLNILRKFHSTTQGRDTLYKYFL